MNLDDLHEAFVAEMAVVAGQRVVVRLEGEPATLIGILGIMQLALRHPALADVAAAEAFAQWARQIELTLAGCGPATARICSMGWSPENDAK